MCTKLFFIYLFTYNCDSHFEVDSVLKFADVTVVVGKIRVNDESACLQDIENLVGWCRENNLKLNVDQTQKILAILGKWEMLATSWW